MTRRAVAKRPEGRTTEVEVTEGAYAGWWCRIRADFPAKLVADLQSGQVDRILSALPRIMLEHNFPRLDDGELAADLGDVDFNGLVAVTTQAFDRIAKLPPR